MADCNKTVDFLRTLSRFCAGRRCSDCALCPNIYGERVKESCIAMVGDIGVAYAEPTWTTRRWPSTGGCSPSMAISLRRGRRDTDEL